MGGSPNLRHFPELCTFFFKFFPTYLLWWCWSSSILVVFHFCRHPFWLPSILFVFHFVCFPFQSSSILVVFHIGPKFAIIIFLHYNLIQRPALLFSQLRAILVKKSIKSTKRLNGSSLMYNCTVIEPVYITVLQLNYSDCFPWMLSTNLPCLVWRRRRTIWP